MGMPWEPRQEILAVENQVVADREDALGRMDHFDGVIDEFRIYSKILGQATVKSHYNSGNGTYGRPEYSQIGGWHFDEGDGTIAFDYSGHGHDGVLENGTLWGEGIVTLPPGF